MVEVAAHLVGRVVDGVDLEAGGFELLLGNHQLLHAAGGGQLAGSPLLVALHAQEASKDDEHNDEGAGETGDRFKVDGDGPGLEGERGVVRLATEEAHTRCQQGVNPGHQAQQQRE